MNEQRGEPYPVRAHAVAVYASLRLRCAARSEGAPRNSLHSLRSLRSDSLGESDERSALRAPPSALRCSLPQKSPAPGAAHRAATPRCSSMDATVVPAKPWSGVRRRRHDAALRNAELMAARAQRALQHLTRRDCSSVANAVSAASFSAGHRDRVPEGSRPAGPTASPTPAHARPRLCSSNPRQDGTHARHADPGPAARRRCTACSRSASR